jgi:hypothetical protein
MNTTDLSAANTMDVDVRGPSKRLGHQRVPAGHVGVRLGFGAELPDGSRMEAVTLVKPVAAMLTFLDRLRAAVLDETTAQPSTDHPADHDRRA